MMMQNFFTVFSSICILYIAVTHGEEILKELRLHDGIQAKEGQFPYIVGVKERNSTDDPQCSGTIISNRHILIEAWCLNLFEDITIIAGCIEWHGDDCVTFDVGNVTIHPDYAGSWKADIAIISTAEEIVFDDFISSIPVSSVRVENATEMIIAGWASWLTNDLTWLDINALDEETCQERWSFADADFLCSLPGHLVAAGDWGSPVTVEDELVAIAIMSGTYDLHLRLDKYVDFIDGIINAQ